MRKQAYTLTTLILVFFVTIPPTIPVMGGTDLSYGGKIIYVDDDGGGDFTSIQDAIDAASKGDIIKIYSGLYKEPYRLLPEKIKYDDNRKPIPDIYNIHDVQYLILKDGISLIGLGYDSPVGDDEGPPIIIPYRKVKKEKDKTYVILEPDYCLFVKGNGITIQNLVFKVSSHLGGLYVYSSSEVNIENCVFQNDPSEVPLGDTTPVAVTVGRSVNTTIQNCYISTWSRGISIKSCKDGIIVSKSTVTKCKDMGISISCCKGSTVSKCNIIENRYGIGISGKSSNILLEKNTISRCKTGICIYYSREGLPHNNNIRENAFSGNEEDAIHYDKLDARFTSRFIFIPFARFVFRGSTRSSSALSTKVKENITTNKFVNNNWNGIIPSPSRKVIIPIKIPVYRFSILYFFLGIPPINPYSLTTYIVIKDPSISSDKGE